MASCRVKPDLSRKPSRFETGARNIVIGVFSARSDSFPQANDFVWADAKSWLKGEGLRALNSSVSLAVFMEPGSRYPMFHITLSVVAEKVA
ncbi:MAG: hypothetical protein A3F33_00180 [Candidatus Woykebacteria bacterium RIFCSPHIGHO2_12_FULL_43_10]|uniref:Uncharacterized protein n=2 Tax=Candidatus Woykeibacteriota TaxID=1817899 RepID=A0A1G1WVT3_9BACT|nr:MAG: hypothetical protein A2802_02080 [Candidatus Woykebacteria bacterium RIFCSPHIGHO2_01_FULL_43_29]OGY28845.1 MAG: hypothetical protein A3F33_00180 [Candidatus Woykebacteria bacterium RIFCSPHIGHO2_12_FULL_43_10]OGY30206.1 MAG: hypothetical protein A3J50_02010 [Candidatus Woykebacteria bacterium RIFCSPHIGHO2_02_FULL_43_16b]OGY31868.1 MAG: hypothetical protein A3A61_03075 [Candidatus Woykebacteria bacterium RIFCSPLOWO2_01_FULL_43_14]